jgi:hypothetical protein
MFCPVRNAEPPRKSPVEVGTTIRVTAECGYDDEEEVVQTPGDDDQQANPNDEEEVVQTPGDDDQQANPNDQEEDEG